MDEQITWVYPNDNHTTYEASTFILGSVHRDIESLTLNGKAVMLILNDHEKAFAQSVDLDEGQNTLTLMTSHGETLTRIVTRIAPWQMQNVHQLLEPVLPDSNAYTPRVFLGESLTLQCRASQRVLSVWAQVIDDEHHVVMEVPMTTLHMLYLEKDTYLHGERSAIFGELHYTTDYPPLHSDIRVFETCLTFDPHSFSSYDDTSKFSIRYVVEQQRGDVQTVETEQNVILWKYPRHVQVSDQTVALYFGESNRAKRHPMMPPLGSHFVVMSMPAEDTFIVEGSTASPRLTLLGGELISQAGRPRPQLLDTLSHHNGPDEMTTVFKLHRRCGVLITIDACGLVVDITGVTVGLNQGAYTGNFPFSRWQLDNQDASKGTARLRYPIDPNDQTVFRGMRSQWTHAGLRVTLLKKQATFTDLRIMLDPGHGGEELGTTALNGHFEKDWTLVMAQRIQHLLHEAGVANVALTRTQDVEMSLIERAKRVEAFDADICLSIHANALPDGRDPLGHKGVSTHTYTPWSQGLGNAIHESLVGAGRPCDGRWENNFAMTRLTTAQSVVVEFGYFIHPEEYTELLNDDIMWQLARATVNGIRQSKASA